VQAELQRLERSARYQQLPIENDAGFGDGLQPGGDLGEVALQWLSVAGLEMNEAVAAVGKAVEPSYFGS
jgi:hypothetical protein